MWTRSHPQPPGLIESLDVRSHHLNMSHVPPQPGIFREVFSSGPYFITQSLHICLELSKRINASRLVNNLSKKEGPVDMSSRIQPSLAVTLRGSWSPGPV